MQKPSYKWQELIKKLQIVTADSIAKTDMF